MVHERRAKWQGEASGWMDKSTRKVALKEREDALKARKTSADAEGQVNEIKKQLDTQAEKRKSAQEARVTLSKELEQHFAALTPSYHTYTPWVEVPTGSVLDHQSLFLYTVCDQYAAAGGDLPPGCPQYAEVKSEKCPKE